ncbi:hypothetical protein BON30_24730 [Cystobacter ferrugineus]|uniref:Peptidase metallopeptidase domain-containing protein n=2 Tax=Cystobacter ferrugineus TaxID=83449 RepID=A0A1L9B7V9_9BACT|nr:hypothetical protein BON30_24730 [Cystobacter ferrugineus]
MTFSEFKSRVYQEPESGTFIVDGDVPLINEEQLQEHYIRYVRGGGLSVNQSGGADTVWSSTQKLRISYCVSTSFGSNYDRVVQAMNQASKDWEDAAHVAFMHNSSQDSNCTASNANVVFDVRPAPSSATYSARAFFPDYARSSRNLLIHSSAFGSLTWTLTGILRHELGHTLGFRHEHTRPEAGTCYEDGNWRELTSYDSASVMHYPHCNGGNSGDLVLTPRDKSGAQSVYGAGLQAVVGDFNGDGRQDLFSYKPGDNQAWVSWSNGINSWTRSSILYAGYDFWDPADRAVVFDFNNDRRDDLFFYRPGKGAAFVLRSNGDGSFTAVYGGGGIGGYDMTDPNDKALALDYDGDGDDDLFLHRPGAGFAYVLRSNGDGSFTTVYGGLGIGGYDLGDTRDQALVLDFNNDGRDDLFLYRPGGGAAYVLRSNGDGSFSHVYGGGGIGGYDMTDPNDKALALDYDGDGDDDLFLHRPGAGFAYVLRSNGDGSFTTVYGGLGIGGYDLGDIRDQALVFDFNNDRREDLFLYRLGGSAAYVLRSNGDGSFSAVYGGLGMAGFGSFQHQDAALALDYNSDGNDELFIYRDGRVGVALSNGSGQFSTVYSGSSL